MGEGGGASQTLSRQWLLPLSILCVCVRVCVCVDQWNPSIADTLGTASCVQIKGGVLISGVVLLSSLFSWGQAW